MTDEINVELTAMAHGGSALGRYQNKTIFIPYTIPGEVVQAQIVQDKGRIAFAHGTKLIEASTDRVYPLCPHFGPGRCGRCQWQHIDSAVQPLLKQDILLDQLARIGGFDDVTLDAAARPVIPSPEAWYYNYHMTMSVTPQGELGYPSTIPGETFIIEECHIIHRDLLDLFYQLDLDFSGVQRLRLQQGSDGNQMIVLYIEDEANAPEIEVNFPTSVNLVLPTNEPLNLVGDLHVHYTVLERTFQVSAGSDFRANYSQLGNLAQLIREAVPAGKTVLDLYAGVGFFSAWVAPTAQSVTTVDSYPPAVVDALVNLADLEQVQMIESTVEDYLTELNTPYDVVILDPPSEGISIPTADALGRLHIPQIVYISSDPATLARDAKRLAQHGYQLRSVQAIDLSPQTYYIDSVAVLTL